MSNENEILTIAGERVEKRYSARLVIAAISAAFGPTRMVCVVQNEPEDKDAPDDARKYTDLRLSPILRLLGMIGKWTKAADFYTGKLADSLEKHGFTADAKCVREHLRARRGEPVARATQDVTEAVTIEGWAARDKSGELCFYLKEPSRGMFVWISESEFSCLPRTLFPYLCWEDEPKKVSVTIKAE